MRIDSVTYRNGEDVVILNAQDGITLEKNPNGEVEVTGPEGVIWIRDWSLCQVGEVRANQVRITRQTGVIYPEPPMLGLIPREPEAAGTQPAESSAEEWIPPSVKPREPEGLLTGPRISFPRKGKGK